MAWGVVAEYNPFHFGHKKHMEECAKLSPRKDIVVVMSGNFVQRGEPAIVSKYRRARMALLSGASIVIELPMYYATSSAEYFAFGAISLLEETKIVDSLCFGSESGDLKALSDAAIGKEKESREFKSHFNTFINQGLSFPAALSAAKKANGATGEINSPNDILGTEYLQALSRLGSGIRPFPIKRQGAGYHSEDINQIFPSATALRKAVLERGITDFSPYMPSFAADIFHRSIEKKEAPVFLDHLSPFLHSKLRQMSQEELKGIMDIGEGLENRILEGRERYYSLSEIAAWVKTKRYPLSRIRRALLHIILGMSKQEFHFYFTAGPHFYIRVLGFRKDKEGLLKEMAAKADLPVVASLKNPDKRISRAGMQMLEKELEATEIYRLGLRNSGGNMLPEKREMAVVVV